MVGSWWPWRRNRLPAWSARRWVVADVESSGLDPRRDRLLAIAATAVHFDESAGRPHIVFADSFEVLLRQPSAERAQINRDNILLHGIGVGAQQQGLEPRDALQRWCSYVGSSPLVAYHSTFDQTMIDRALIAHLGRPLPNPWLDLEPLAAVLHDQPRRRSLDHWLNQYRIACLRRHQAAADTLATAQLLLALWPRVSARVSGHFSDVLDLAESARFMPGRSG